MADATSTPKIILVVENDHETRVSVRRMLEEAGHFVVSSANAGEAISMMDKISKPSLILISAKLPLMDGKQFFEAVRSNHAFDDVPIAQIGEVGETRIEGTCCFLPKPLKREDLLRAAQFGTGPCD